MAGRPPADALAFSQTEETLASHGRPHPQSYIRVVDPPPEFLLFSPSTTFFLVQYPSSDGFLPSFFLNFDL
jgi:hypothetical protein